MPNWKKVIVSGSDAILNQVTASGGILTSQDIMPDADNTLSLGSSTQRFQLNGGTPVTVDGSGTANTLTRFQSATTVEDSSIFSSDTLTRISHDNDGNDVFIISGSNGELLKVTDTIGDTLFQVNDGSGITQFEVSSSGLTTTGDVEIDDWGSVSASLASLDASTYNDSDVTDHINSLGVVSGSSQITISDTTGYTAFSSSIASDIAAIDSSVTLQDATDNGSTTTNSITIDGGSDASLTLDRNANSNDAEIVFKTNGTENWSIGTGQIGGDASFTIRGQGSANYFVLDTNGDLSVTSSGSFGHLSVDNEISSSDVRIDGWNSVSSSLADLNNSIDGIDSSVTLQDATDNGNTTTNDIITSGTISGSALQLQANGQTSLFQVESISVSGTSTTIASYAVDTYAGAIIDYTLYHNTKPTGMRTGQLFIVFDEDGEIRVTDSSTSDIGDTSEVTFEGSNNGTTAAVSMETPDANWNIKMIRRSL